MEADADQSPAGGDCRSDRRAIARLADGAARAGPDAAGGRRFRPVAGGRRQRSSATGCATGLSTVAAANPRPGGAGMIRILRILRLKCRRLTDNLFPAAGVRLLAMFFARHGIPSMHRCSRCLQLLAIAVAIGAGAVSPADAVDPAKQFLDGLRSRKYYEMALEYLDTIPGNPAVPVEFKQTLAYERGVTLVEGARWQRDPAIRDK